MKKIRVLHYALIVTTSMFLFSCQGLEVFKENADKFKYEVNPNPLEMHSDSVVFTVSGIVPAETMHKKAILEIVPVLNYGGQTKELQSLKLQGEDVKDNYKVINYKTGGNFELTVAFPYSDEMRRSTLSVKGIAWMAEAEDAKIELGEMKVAEGIITTPELIRPDPQAIIAADQFKRVTIESQKADINYVVSQSNVRWSELREDDIKQMIEFLEQAKEDQKRELKNIDVIAAASPDGPVDLNTNLASARNKSAQDYLDKELKKKELADKAKVESKEIPEDWQGFKELVEESSLEDKELLLRVLQQYSDPVQREKEIKNLAAVYDQLRRDILPALRRSQMIVNVNVTGKTDEELLALAKSNPDSLKIEEILFAATLTDNEDEKLAIYQAAAKKHTNDYRPINNVGVIYYRKGQYDKAKQAFNDAQKINDQAAVLLNNMGCVAIMEGDYDAGLDYFLGATGAGKEVNNNLAMFMVKRGNYGKAVQYCEGSCGFNCALALLLDGQTQNAKGKLDCIEEKDALVYYLFAVIAAREQQTENLFLNLEKAIEMDGELSSYAKEDMEFREYFDDAKFKALAK